ncbi:MAG: aminoacyl-tRNA hydrolase [Vicinamibacterales bacterium]
MKLVAGLGNPGPQYRDTRHNVGFVVVDRLADRWQVADRWRESHQALVAKATVGGGAVLLAKPVTFMNLSGEAVGGLASYYRIDPADVLVIVDEVALPLGRLRARREGSAGGHNGLKSVIQHLGTTAFPRLRIGVGRGDTRRELASHVLGKFAPDEHDEMEAALRRAAEAAEMFVSEGIERVMNVFNAANDSQQDPGPA